MNLESFVIDGELYSGPETVFLNDAHEVVDDESKSRYIYCSTQHGLVIHNKKIVGTRGSHKFFFRVDDRHGLLVFYSMRFGRILHPNVMERTVKSYRQLYKHHAYPSFKEGTIKMECSNTDFFAGNASKRKPSAINKFRANARVPVLFTDAISYPVRVFDKHNKEHMRLYRDMLARTELSETDFRSHVIDFLVHDMRVLDPEFIEQNPLFSVSHYVSFCTKMQGLLDSGSVVPGRQSKFKWGNVIYCQNQKKWFWVDC